MTHIFKRLLPALTGLLAVVSSATANLAYTDGDLLLGFRSNADPGSTQDYVVNLGPASQFTQATESFVVPGLGNIAADLAIFSDVAGDSWFSRADVLWAIVGTDLAADPANTLYATRPRVNVNTQTSPWQRRAFSGQSTTNSTFRAFISGFILSNVNAVSPKGTIQSISAINSYASFTSGGTDFGFFSGIEGNFGAGTAGSVLDLYRLTPTTQNPAGQGLLFVGTFQLNNSGALTFTPPPPTAPTFRLSASTFSANEDAGTASVRVIRGGLTTGTDTVRFDTSDGTATSPLDYAAKTNFTVEFAPGVTQVDVLVDVVNRAGLQTSRAFNVALTTPSAGTVGSPSTATVTINDTTPQNFGQIALSAATYSFAPVNDQGTPNLLAIPLTRTNGSDGAVSVDLTVAAGGSMVAGTDFNIVGSATVSFAAGETSKTANIQLLAIADTKLPGTINLSLTNAQGGVTLGATATATVTVTARDSINPSFKLATKSGKSTSPTIQITGTAKDNTDISRVEVKVNGGTAQLATLGALTNGTRSLTLGNVALENGKNTIVVTAFDTSGNPAKSVTLKIAYANSRPALAGNYSGLITPTGSPTNANTGFVFATVTPTGLFTGKVTIGNAVVSIKGIFDNAGVAHFNVKGDTTAAPVALALSKKVGAITTQFGNLALAIATDKLTGTLKDQAAATIANADADRAFFDGKTPATTVEARFLENKGAYTVVFPARTSQIGLNTTQFPQGDGVATLKITAKGVVTLRGILADGSAISASAPVSKTYRWPFFVKLYKTLGVISGPVTFDDTQTNSDLTATNVVWIRPAIANAKHYPNGWPGGIFTDIIGANYAAVAGTAVLPGVGAPDLTNGNVDLQFFDGKLTTPVTKTVSLATTNKVTNAPADKSFSLKLKAPTGLFSGKFKHTDNSSPAFNGVILQKGPNAAGFGYFLSTVPKNGPTGESGAVTLQAHAD